MKNRLKELRKKRELTLINLSKELDIPRSTLSRYENSDSESKQDTWEQIAEYFDVSVAYLLGIEEVVVRENRIKALRNEKKLTLKELGEVLGIRDNTLSQYETGKRTPRDPETWENIANYFNVPVTYLMGLDDNLDKLNELEEMGKMLIEMASGFTHPSFSDTYPEWSSVSDVGERLIELSKEMRD